MRLFPNRLGSQTCPGFRWGQDREAQLWAVVPSSFKCFRAQSSRAEHIRKMKCRCSSFPVFEDVWGTVILFSTSVFWNVGKFYLIALLGNFEAPWNLPFSEHFCFGINCSHLGILLLLMAMWIGAWGWRRRVLCRLGSECTNEISLLPVFKKRRINILWNF